MYNLYYEDVLREIYFNQEKCAVIILEFESIAEVKSIVDHLPLVRERQITF